MTISEKADYPPLLPPGIHRFWLSEVWKLCVERFELSRTRSRIMSGLEAVVHILSRKGIVGDLWIDGSFVTEKIDPEDVDVVLGVAPGYVESVSDEQYELLEWFVDREPFRLFRCDSYIFDSPDRYAYWRDWFGRGRNSDPKGIASISLPTCGPRWPPPLSTRRRTCGMRTLDFRHRRMR